eukprot:PhM_4_TR1377/c0_g1_i1/m.40147
MGCCGAKPGVVATTMVSSAANETVPSSSSPTDSSNNISNSNRNNVDEDAPTKRFDGVVAPTHPTTASDTKRRTNINNNSAENGNTSGPSGVDAQQQQQQPPLWSPTTFHTSSKDPEQIISAFTSQTELLAREGVGDTVEVIAMSWGFMGPRAAERTMSGLWELRDMWQSALTSLTFVGNELTDKTMRWMAETCFLQLPCLTTVCLACNRITVDGLTAILGCIDSWKPSRLQTLDLSGNEVALVSAEPVANAILHNTTLRVIRLEDNPTKSSVARRVARFLKKGIRLGTLNANTPETASHSEITSSDDTSVRSSDTGVDSMNSMVRMPHSYFNQQQQQQQQTMMNRSSRQHPVAGSQLTTTSMASVCDGESDVEEKKKNFELLVASGWDV